MADTTHYGCNCDVCGVKPMEGTIYLDPDPLKDFGACESCYNGNSPSFTPDNRRVIRLTDEAKAALHGPIYTYTDAIRFSFKCIDTSGSGVISRDEMNTFMAGMGMEPEKGQQVFNRIDSNQDGVISFSEFWSFFRDCSNAPEAPAPDLEEEEAAPAAAAPKSQWV